MSMIDFYTWIEHSTLGVWMRYYTYGFSAIEVVHLFGVTLLLGTIYTVNFRLCGIALKSRTVSEIARGLARWTLWGYVVTLSTGVMLFASEALKMSENGLWPYKTTFLFAALILQFTVYRSITKPGRAEASPMIAKLTGIVSAILWFCVGMAARGIAFI
jgi:predicted exporter